MDVPMFIFSEGRKGSSEQKSFIKDTKADIQAVMDLLFKRGMWSSYHYTKWTKELIRCNDEEILHLWWDGCVSGPMAEIESTIEESIEEYAKMKANKMSKCKNTKMI